MDVTPNSNELAVWTCLAVIIGAPFFFKTWLDHRKPLLAAEVQKKTSLLSWMIFAALFTGGFAFKSASSSLGGALLFAAIISFSILFQLAGRYQQSMNRANPRSLVAERASLRQTAGRFAVGAALCAVLAKFSLAILFLPFVIPFLMPLFIRLQHRCTPMADSALKTEIISSFKNEGVMLANILIVDEPDSKSKNAFIAGTGYGAGPFGRTLFVTLDLFKTLDREEFRAVMLHEAAHLKLHHVTKRVFAAIFMTVVAAFWIALPATFLSHGHPLVDLAAVSMGASSDALVSALEKISAGVAELQHPLLRVLNGNLYPSVQSRIGCIRAFTVPDRLTARTGAPALAYSLLVLGVVFWSAGQTLHPAKVSRSAGAIAGR
jgi:hypothetical protein